MNTEDSRKRDLHIAIYMHVSTRFYPRLPVEYVEIATEAIDLIMEHAVIYPDADGWDLDDWAVLNMRIEIPDGLKVLPRNAFRDGDDGPLVITVAEAIRILRLDGFVDMFARAQLGEDVDVDDYV